MSDEPSSHEPTPERDTTPTNDATPESSITSDNPELVDANVDIDSRATV